MNTTGFNIPKIKQIGHENYEIALEELEFTFHKKQLKEIKELHNNGFNYNQISRTTKRDPYEVIIALLHLVREGEKMRPFLKGAVRCNMNDHNRRLKRQSKE